MSTDETALQRLEHIGFRPAGNWALEDGNARCTLTDCAFERNILYALVVDGEVMYVGKTVRTLKSRLYGYQNPGPTQSTNIKGNKLIIEALRAGRAVTVYALPDNGLLHYGGFHVNLAAGLEDSLVSTLKPAWNKTGA
ncbi:GIY-YIG nuclease family protein [Thioalkalivibrio sp. ALJ16]|uniref:GIY-YIG nuclease family protein n=1 Tax=Thioalkalivibrio sp. ALJ16 TaxID=1158762 RepID=UPI0003687BDB|nr:GIY-YIG nuclease family protein [Thioalkalivibrio sp. ALJ16]